MCRLLAVWGVDLKSQIAEILDQFQELSSGGQAPHGWGLVAFRGEQIVFLRKKHMAAITDADYSEAARKIEGFNPTLVVGHLRRSALGIKGAHPFWGGRLVFCHNGSMLGSNAIPLTSDYEKMRRGGTGAERFFLYLLQLYQEEGERAIASAINYVRDNHSYRALNFILTDGRILWAVREANKSHEHYSLYRGQKDNDKLGAVCSEPLLIPHIKWEMIDNHFISREEVVAA